MKLSLIILSTTFFLLSCSGTSEPVSLDTSGLETAETVEDPDTESAEEGSTTAGDEADEDESDTEDVGDEADGDESDTEGVEQKNVKLVVNNQETIGQIIVEEVATSRDGWVSVHRSKEDGGIQLPDGIGEARVDSGDNEEIIVDLWEATEAGEKLWVLLHVDAGERGKYEFPGKDAAVTKDGKTMARSFVVEGDEDEDEEDE